MDKFNAFVNKLNEYKIICEKICSHKDNLGECKVFLLNKDFNYLDILKTLKDTVDILDVLKKTNTISYSLISDDFETNVYYSSPNNNNIEISYLKKQYNEVFNIIK